MLLGWHRPANGRVRVDDLPLDGNRLEQLRRDTAWVDPAVQLWNRSFFDNLVYGGAGSARPLRVALDGADLHDLLERLPDGLQTQLGEGGAPLQRMPGGMLKSIGETSWQRSHGERSRLYIARALLQGADLVILDESFAALDPENLAIASDCVLRRAPTLLVIAHP